MTYMDHVPAQKRAASYLQHVMKEFPKGRFLVAGHSKGGNLATYACSYLPDPLFERVDAIYSYDAPGLNKTIIETEGYQRTSPNIRRFVPQGSIVGMMLEVPEPTTIVKSRAFGGLLFLTIFEGGKTSYLIQFLPQILLVASIGLAGFTKKENI